MSPFRPPLATLPALAVLLALLVIAACGSTPAPSVAPSEPLASPTAGQPTSSPTDGIPGPSPTSEPTAQPTAEPTATPAPTPGATPTPAAAEIVRFRREGFTEEARNVVDCSRPGFPGSILLRWRVRNATGVTLSIDGPGIFDSYSGTSGEAEVPFACSEPQHTYTLATTGGSGPPATLTRTITRGAPVIRDFAVIGPNCTSSDPVPVSVTWEIAHASGVEVWVDGALFATYSGRSSPPEGASAGSFDCSKESQDYTLRTTGDYGPPDEMTLTAIP